MNPSYLTDENKAKLYTYYIADTYRALEKEQIAINKFNEALKFRPNFVPALLSKGVSLSNLENYNEAIECYDRALKIEPNYANVWDVKGLALQNLRKLQ